MISTRDTILWRSNNYQKLDTAHWWFKRFKAFQIADIFLKNKFVETSQTKEVEVENLNEANARKEIVKIHACANIFKKMIWPQYDQPFNYFIRWTR